jgi:predicted trehalose synthase
MGSTHGGGAGAAASAWHDEWYRVASAVFLGSYLRGLEGASLLPEAGAELQAMLQFHLLEKCIYELRYELDNRPDWVLLPLEGLAELASGDP